ncbi:hypothetical protein IOC61_10690 [Halomonas sp. KAO]|uniref:hypothetical protein n=1 Tax=Halomonas sp. KAO TaxID=2783858 RepID=UPI00189F8224|nr:hypothetical protein [Halomonas sp. KAO]MBF7053794.1 hypothetical protein [Halomonas sp. KAO]
MSPTTATRHDVPKQAWWTLLVDSCYRATTPKLVQDMQHEASHAYNEMLEDLDLPLDAHFEREMARQLQSGQPLGFKPARTLMPVLMQRFGLQEAELATDPDYGAMRATCNGCPVVGRCWKAMRGGADLEECRGFCPNAEAFDSRAAQ